MRVYFYSAAAAEAVSVWLSSRAVWAGSAADSDWDVSPCAPASVVSASEFSASSEESRRPGSVPAVRIRSISGNISCDNGPVAQALIDSSQQTV